MGTNNVAPLISLIPGLAERNPKNKCPGCGWGGASALPPNVFQLVVHMNDSHQYSFERIAEVLESLPVDLGVNDDVERSDPQGRSVPDPAL